MRPQEKQLRIVELLPGGDRITSRPLRFVASLNDLGDIAVQGRGLDTATDLVPCCPRRLPPTRRQPGYLRRCSAPPPGRPPRMRCAVGGHHG